MLASRNLFQDRLRFVATLIGIVFSVVPVLVQRGLGFRPYGKDHDRP
jgi:putative ABC transport system permease protein